jgi:hypothetical protein
MLSAARLRRPYSIVSKPRQLTLAVRDGTGSCHRTKQETQHHQTAATILPLRPSRREGDASSCGTEAAFSIGIRACRKDVAVGSGRGQTLPLPQQNGANTDARGGPPPT